MDHCPKCGNFWNGEVCDNCRYKPGSKTQKKPKPSTAKPKSDKPPAYSSPVKKSESSNSFLTGCLGFISAIICGSIGLAIGSAAWVGLAVLANYEIGFIAILIGVTTGFGVGFGVKLSLRGQPYTGSGLLYGILGAFMSVVGVYISNVISIACFAYREDPSQIVVSIIGSFIVGLPIVKSLMLNNPAGIIYELLFNGLALWCGFKYTFLGLLQEKK